MVQTAEKEGIRMTATVVSLEPAHSPLTSEKDNLPTTRTYQTNTSFVAVYFDRDGKGRIVFLPFGATIRVIGRSSCLPAGFEVVFEHQHYNVFEIDVLVRSTPICEPVQAQCRAAAA
jgi:hypothetical protein